MLAQEAQVAQVAQAVQVALEDLEEEAALEDPVDLEEEAALEDPVDLEEQAAPVVLEVLEVLVVAVGDSHYKILGCKSF
jgi:hypothetical protein